MSRSRRKDKTVKHKIGKTCPRCGKNKLVGCDQKNKEGHKHHVICDTCHFCNF